MINQIIKDWVGEDRELMEDKRIKKASETDKKIEMYRMGYNNAKTELRATIPQLTERIIEIINTVEVKENPPFSANSEIREKAKIINTYLMPAVKEAIINTLKGGKE